MSNIFRAHDMQTANGRAVCPGNDYRCITGYHLLWHGYQLTGDRTQHDTDTTIAPLDAPDRMPAGGCIRCERPDFTSASQALIWRG